MTPYLEKEGPVASTSSKPAPAFSKETQQASEEESSQEPSRKGKRKSQLAQTLPSGVLDPQIGALSSGQCPQYGHDSHGNHSQRAGEDEKELSTEIIKEIEFVKSSIDLELGKFDAKKKEITSVRSELKRNDKAYTKWYKLTDVKLDSIPNTCDRIESKCQDQEYEIGDISISHINEQLEILRDKVLGRINNTNQFATHLAKCDSERQKLKNEIIANIERIHKNYEPHIPRHSTPLTEEKRSVKGSLAPF
ncbi:hypothetical protein O181_052354 [Austropuccinia psidii MF-1]|uniref:Uncharacterized protein n=1 Tax=Austropuccinia psidii MF-1 TaxID=1389203 RepID=A0A9Q3E0J1_9BASI|nr:hypothetical protein [Austropuccinia psidii MF-1]